MVEEGKAGLKRFADLAGQGGLVESLQQAIKSHRVAHAYLVSGEAGSGKKTLALAFAQALLCQEQTATVCGVCSNCRRIEQGTHPDVAVIEPQGGRIRIDEIRTLKDRFALQAYGGSWKVGIIIDAETMTDAAANSLLKLLEEPFGQAVLILLSSSPSKLLPTIVSRCQVVKMQRLSRTQIAAYLEEEEEIPAETALVVAGLADGRLGRAMEVASPKSLAWRERVLAVLAHEDGRGLEALRLAAELDDEPEAIELAFEVMGSWFRDMLLAATGCPQELIVNQDYFAFLSKEGKLYNEHAYHSAIYQIEDTLRAIRANANRRLALDTLLYLLSDLTSFLKASENHKYGKSSRS